MGRYVLLDAEPAKQGLGNRLPKKRSAPFAVERDHHRQCDQDEMRDGGH